MDFDFASSLIDLGDPPSGSTLPSHHFSNGHDQVIQHPHTPDDQQQQQPFHPLDSTLSFGATTTTTTSSCNATTPEAPSSPCLDQNQHHHQPQSNISTPADPAPPSVEDRETCQQVLQIVNSVSPAKSLQNKARLLADIARAFAMLDHPDAVAADLTNFLFAADPAQDVALLTDTDAVQNATTISTSDSTMHVGSSLSALLNSEFVFDVILIPAAVHGVFSFGVVCNARYGKPPKLCSKNARRNRGHIVRDVTFGRYCRNETNGDMFAVLNNDDPSGGDTQVVHISEISNTSRYFMRINFRNHILRRSLPSHAAQDDPDLDLSFLESPDSANTASAHSVPDILHFAEAAQSHSAGRQTRFCSICSAAPFLKCNCKLTFQTPRHPRDFATVRANSVYMTGDFFGEMEKISFCERSRKYIAARVLSRMSAHPKLFTCSPDLLHSTVIQIRMGSLSPVTYELPFQIGPHQVSGSGSSKDSPDGGTCLLPSSIDARNEIICPCDSAFSSLEAYGSGEDGAVGISGFASDGVDTQSPLNDLEQLNYPDVGDIMEAAVAVDITSSLDGSSSELVWPEVEMKPDMGLGQSIVELLMDSSHESEGTSENVTKDDPGGSSIGSVSSQAYDQTPELLSPPSPATHDASVPSDKDTAPAPSIRASGTEMVVGAVIKLKGKRGRKKAVPTGDPGQYELERAARQELRRQKNRAAATRSNARRKERNESLRRNLSLVRERLAVLRGAEKVLREENERLRGEAGLGLAGSLQAKM